MARDQQVLLLLQVSEQDALGNLRPIGYTVYDVAPNHTVRYGTYESDLQQAPIALRPSPTQGVPKDVGSLRFSVLRPTEFYDEGEFVPNKKPQYLADEEWDEDEEDGFDIYIDQLTNLPDNVSVVKVFARLINNKEKEFVSWRSFYPQAELSSVQNQVYNEKFELRGQVTDPTLLL